jgi:hypothetical protein
MTDLRAALTILRETWEKKADADWHRGHDDVADGVWAYQHEANGAAKTRREDIADLDAILAASEDPALAPHPAPDVVEALAAYAHKSWSGWMRYLFSRCEKVQSGVWAGDLVMPREWRERWRRQADLPYADLREDEKESDREEARKILAVLAASALARAPQSGLLEHAKAADAREIEAHGYTTHPSRTVLVESAACTPPSGTRPLTRYSVRDITRDIFAPEIKVYLASDVDAYLAACTPPEPQTETLALLLLREKYDAEKPDIGSAYCWFCRADVNGGEPHEADCWGERVRNLLASAARAASQEGKQS